MPAAVVRSAFEVAYWFIDRGRQVGQRIAPLHLQQLLYVAQAAYAAQYAGRSLMPAAFVADELGPVEPNVHAALSAATPQIALDGTLPVAVEAVLQRVWRRHAHDPEALLRLTKHSSAYREARARGAREPIPLAAMIASAPESDEAALGPPATATRLLRTQSGRSVRVGPWLPTASSPSATKAAPETAAKPAGSRGVRK